MIVREPQDHTIFFPPVSRHLLSSCKPLTSEGEIATGKMHQSRVEDGFGLEPIASTSLHAAVDGCDRQEERQQQPHEVSEARTDVDLGNLVDGLSTVQVVEI